MLAAVTVVVLVESAGGAGRSVISGYGRGVGGSAGVSGESVNSGYGRGVGCIYHGSRCASGSPLPIWDTILIRIIAGLFVICTLSACSYCHSKKAEKISFKEYFSEVSKVEEAVEPWLHVAPDVEKPTQTVEIADAVPVVLGKIVETSVGDLPKHGVYSEYNPYTSQATPLNSKKINLPSLRYIFLNEWKRCHVSRIICINKDIYISVRNEGQIQQPTYFFCLVL